MSAEKVDLVGVEGKKPNSWDYRIDWGKVCDTLEADVKLDKDPHHLAFYAVGLTDLYYGSRSSESAEALRGWQKTGQTTISVRVRKKMQFAKSNQKKIEEKLAKNRRRDIEILPIILECCKGMIAIPEDRLPPDYKLTIEWKRFEQRMDRWSKRKYGITFHTERHSYIQQRLKRGDNPNDIADSIGMALATMEQYRGQLANDKAQKDILEKGLR